jgi:hypothetical protein
VDTLLEIPGQLHLPDAEKGINKTQAEDVVCVFLPPPYPSLFMFEAHYLSFTFFEFVTIDLIFPS